MIIIVTLPRAGLAEELKRWYYWWPLSRRELLQALQASEAAASITSASEMPKKTNNTL